MNLHDRYEMKTQYWLQHLTFQYTYEPSHVSDVTHVWVCGLVLVDVFVYLCSEIELVKLLLSVSVSLSNN